MTISVAPDTAEWIQYGKEGSAGRMIGDLEKLGRGPQAFIVRRDQAIAPHFHPIDQFQIFYLGDAMLGKHELPPVTVHYTDGYTPYGPITSGPDGFSFFNLRARSDVGVHWMPEARSELARRPGRSFHVHCGVGIPAGVGSAACAYLIDPEPDGLTAFSTVAAPGKPLAQDVAGGAGRFELVLSGSLLSDGAVLLPTHSVIFAHAGEALPPRRAGSEGVQVLTLQSPTN